jgi:hypothetical protein
LFDLEQLDGVRAEFRGARGWPVSCWQAAMATEHVDTEDEDVESVLADLLFESFYDRDSGSWSLRRIPSEPPADPDHP